MKKRQILHISCILLIFIFLLTGCRVLRRPDPSPVPDSPNEEERQADDKTPEIIQEPTVDIPEQISKGEEQEPELSVFIAETGAIQKMKMEEYVMGVVAAEMEPTWDKEALAAQAIKARTFALQRIDEDGGVPERNADASSDIQEFQAYNPDRINDNVRKAVEDTRGLVAVHEDEYVRGWFHAYCGGLTATAKEGLNFQGQEPPFIHRAECPCFDGIDEQLRYWKESYSKNRIRNVVRQITGEDPGTVNTVKVGEESEDRALTIIVNDTKVSAPEFRLALDSTKFKSTIINDISIQGNKVTFEGQGYGHGVGLCQWGAYIFARDQGLTAQEIITHYFEGVTIQKLWD